MRFLFLLVATALGLAALDLGEKAPALASITWVKGAPVVLQNQITVIEFWATWCQPCRISFPHLSKLAQTYAGKVAFVGLSNEEPTTVSQFVAKLGSQMDFHVGLVDEATDRGYRAESEGIPLAFVIGPKQTVLWKGRPFNLDRVLAELDAGTYDQAKETKLATLDAELQVLIRTRVPESEKNEFLHGVLSKTEQILSLDPVARQALDVRLEVAKMLNDAQLIRSTLEAIPVARLTGDQAASHALRLIQDEVLTLRFPDLALAMANRAVAADPAAAESHAARAAVLQALGLADAALASQELAAKADPEGQGAMLIYLRELRRVREQFQTGMPATAPEPPAKAAASPLPATILP